jgi:hypothetical protein
MNVVEFLEKQGFYTFQHANQKFNELKDQFMEMGQLKSDFDIEKFTVKKEGNFIAHNFHFLMRQYSLALSELRRMLIEKEEIERKIDEVKDKGKSKILIYTNDGQKEKYADLYLKELINQLDMVELNIVNKAMMVRGFEACRLKLIELNEGTPPTNEQYQREEPEYLKWILQSIALRQIKQHNSGITEGTWTNIDMLEEPPLINSEFQVKMLDDKNMLNLDEAHDNIMKRRKLNYDYDNMMLDE